MIKIGYFADGAWAHKAFEKLIIDKTIQITFICVRYDNPDKILMKYAEKYNIDLLCHKNINSEEFLEKLRSYNADLFVSMSFNQIFKKEILELPVLNSINCHAGKLPFYRGRNVLTWALINDETEYGITVHYIDLGIDTGDIILQEVFSITDEDDYNTLLQRAYDGCASILYKAIKLIQDNKVSTIKQEDIDKVGTYCGMRKCGDEIINWNQTSREIFNFVRALCSPGPIATSYIDGVEIKINKVKLIEGAHKYKNINGQVIGKTKQGFLVKTLDTLIEVIEYDYLKQVKVGDRLGGGVYEKALINTKAKLHGDKMLDKILILGIGGHAKSVLSILELNKEFEICGFVDKDYNVSKEYKNYPIIGSDNNLELLYKKGINNAVVGVGFLGGKSVRTVLYHKLKNIGFHLPNIIDPSSVIANDVTMGEGNFIGKQTTINANSKLGSMCIINTGSIIEHDCSIGDFSHISVGSVLCGTCKVGKESMIGSNSVVIQGRSIGDGTIIGAGSVVRHNIGTYKKYFSRYQSNLTELS